MKLRLDSHVDTLHEFARRNIQDFNFNHNQGLKVDIPKLREGGVNALFLALFTKQEWGVKDGRKRINLLGEILVNILNCTGAKIKFCLTPKDIYEAVENDDISVSLGIENGIVIGEDLNVLKEYSDYGVRYLTLCHNFTNQICDSSTDKTIYADLHDGLSDFGKRLIPEMNKIGMMIDVSHASDETVEDVLEISDKPIIASHSNCKNVCDIPRNLNDYLAEKIAQKGGVIQVTALPKCVGGAQTVLSLIHHIDYIVERFGIDAVGIGTDFDGGGRLAGFYDISQASTITRLLEERDYSEEDIDKIWGLNFMRVYTENFNA